MKSLFFALCGLVLVQACSPANSVADRTKSAAPAVDQQFGAPTTAEGAITYDQLLTRMGASPTSSDTVDVKVIGTVESVCQMKGCWMNLVSGQHPEKKMMVRFKDYGFFMPKDISGREVLVDGKAFYSETSIDELRHYAEDAGKSPEEVAAITAPKRELNFEAAGVLLLKQQ